MIFDYGRVFVVSGEGARVGFIPCSRCGAALLLHPDDDINRIDQHNEWHDQLDDRRGAA